MLKRRSKTTFDGIFYQQIFPKSGKSAQIFFALPSAPKFILYQLWNDLYAIWLVLTAEFLLYQVYFSPKKCLRPNKQQQQGENNKNRQSSNSTDHRKKTSHH